MNQDTRRSIYKGNMGHLMLLSLLVIILIVQPDNGANSTFWKAEEALTKNPRLYYLGVSDGKSYFKDDSGQWSWNVARTRCIESGLRMASITSPVQNDFLASKWSILGEGLCYWTGGRDTTRMRQFAWDYDSGTTYVSYGWFNPDPTIRTALAFTAFSGTPPLCSLTATTANLGCFVLCEGV